ncbi:MAG: acetyl-CoA carboxylase carboxyltransferase subunit alpha [Pseudomonadota bacterium]
MLDFEKPVAELEGKIKELQHLAQGNELELHDEIAKLEGRASKLLERTYAKLTAWQKTQVARHADRPHLLDYVERLIDDWTPLAGDRTFGDDPAIIGGLGRFRGQALVVIGQEKGADTDERLRHNFGMARPEGYRKAVRLMRLADRFGLPIVTFVDTPGAHPGVDAEARGQAEAIARSIQTCLEVRVPIVAVVIGEGGSGGAIALATADRVLMLEHSVYSVISPEGCAAILWRSADQAATAADALKITAQDLLTSGLIDTIVEEPIGGAHRARTTTIDRVADAVEASLAELAPLPPDQRRRQRRTKFLAMGRPESDAAG